MKEEEPIGINEEIAYHLGFKKFLYSHSTDGGVVYQWRYPKGWAQPSTPCLSLPDFIAIINTGKDIYHQLRRTGIPLYE